MYSSPYAHEARVMDDKVARLQDLLRQAFALANEIAYTPNVRADVAKTATVVAPSATEVQHYETMHLLADSPKPGPVVPVSSGLQECRIPAADVVLQEPE